MKLMLTCREASRMASQGLDRRLGFAERVALRMHLAVCKGCANVAREMEFLRKAVVRLGEQADRP